jgi:hypothetical protein
LLGHCWRVNGGSFTRRWNPIALYAFSKVELPKGERQVKILMAGMLVVAFAMPALAADEFYVVQDSSTKKCTIVDKKPTTTTTVTQVGPVTFKTRQEAETGMKTIKVCESK